jgi:hypothetical protein
MKRNQRDLMNAISLFGRSKITIGSLGVPWIREPITGNPRWLSTMKEIRFSRSGGQRTHAR